MAALEPQETIIPLIKICRKIEGCSKQQLIQWIISFCALFGDENNWLECMKKMMIKSLCNHHKTMPFNMLEALLSSSPNEQALVDLDDSITKSDLNEDEDDDIETDNEPLTLLRIPKELKIECFTYLKHGELLSAERTCRCMSLAARDPNSLHYLRALSEIDYNHPRYSRVKSLDIAGLGGLRPQCIPNNKWGQTVTCLDSWRYVESLPYFMKLTKCNLLSWGTNLLRNHINFETLKQVKLFPGGLVNNMYLHALIQCVNLEKLEFFPDDVQSIQNDEKLQAILNDPSSNKLDKLKYFGTSSAIAKIPSFFHWLLSNKNFKKSLSLVECSSCDQMALFSKDANGALLAMQNIENLTIGGHYFGNGETNAFPLVFDNLHGLISTNNMKLNEFSFNQRSETLNVSTLSIESLYRILPYFRTTKLCIEFSLNDADSHDIDNETIPWFDNLVSESSFDSFKIELNLSCFDQMAGELASRSKSSNDEQDSAEFGMRILRFAHFWLAKLKLLDDETKSIAFDLKIDIDFGFYADLMEDDFLDKTDFYDKNGDLKEKEYKNARREKVKQLETTWDKTLRPMIIKMLKEKLNRGLIVEKVVTGIPGFHITYQNKLNCKEKGALNIK